MSDPIFPDNTVLCSFAAVRRLHLLEAHLRGRGRWTQAVADEAGRSASHLPALFGLLTAGWLGEPIVIDREDQVHAVERICVVRFGGARKRPREHLGEAQPLWVIRNRAEFAGSWWVSDDRDALEFARQQHITTRETIDIARSIVVGSHLACRFSTSCRSRVGRLSKLSASNRG